MIFSVGEVCLAKGLVDGPCFLSAGQIKWIEVVELRVEWREGTCAFAVYHHKVYGVPVRWLELVEGT